MVKETVKGAYKDIHSILRQIVIHRELCYCLFLCSAGVLDQYKTSYWSYLHGNSTLPTFLDI